MRVAIVGGGAMAEAFPGAALDRAVFSAPEVTVIEKLEARRDQLYARYGVQVSSTFEAMSDSSLVIISVKPQEMRSVAGTLREDAVLLSIMAGVTITSLKAEFGHDRIVRAMPNTPAAVKAGMSAWTATEAVSADQRAFTRTLLSAIGRELYVDDEKKIDMVTAVSGSGPAYVFLFIEALIDAGVHLGFSRRIAEQLVLQTLEGSLAIARTSARHPATLRNMVTSPGGTSAEALYQLEKGGLRTVISKAVHAAYQKSKLLGELSDR